MEEKVRKQRIKKWVTFAVRWGIAIGGIALVLSNISFYDRVQVLDPATNTIQKLRVRNNPGEADKQFTVVPEDGGPPRVVGRDELWVRPDRTRVKVRIGDRVEKVRLWAVKPGDASGAGRGVRQLLVDDPRSDRGLIVDPSQVVEADPPTVTSPYVEVGINRLVRDADTKYLIAAILIMPLSYVLTSVRWHMLLESLGIRLSFFRSLVLNLVGAFYNAFMPGTTGGDVIKAYYAAKQTDLRTRAVLSVLIDRVIGLMALILVGGAMAAYQWQIPDCRRVAMLSGVITAAVVLGLIVFYSRRLRRWTGLDFVLRRLPMQRQVQKAIVAMEIYRHRPTPLVVALLLSFPVHVTSILSATFAGWAFRLPLPVFYYWVVVPVIALVGAIPISPQGAGVMEFFAVELTRRHGVTISQAFVLVMSIRLVQILWNLVAGAFVLRGGYHAPTEKEQESLESDDVAPAPQTTGAVGAVEATSTASLETRRLKAASLNPEP
jgi:glycosyltransferase 2 family protein